MKLSKIIQKIGGMVIFILGLALCVLPWTDAWGPYVAETGFYLLLCGIIFIWLGIFLFRHKEKEYPLTEFNSKPEEL